MSEEQNNQPFSDPNKPAPPVGWQPSVPQEAQQQVQQQVQQQAQMLPQSEDNRRPEASQQQDKQAEHGKKESFSIFGKNGRWLWFAGGVFFVLFGVLITLLFNLGKEPEVRNDALKWALIGMAIGLVLNIITVTMLGGMDAFMGQYAGTTQNSSGSLF
ncbi:MAG: hypothetical protein IJ113_00605 [Eggerthellaceae bacterium]|nr:hypothetical protein [Eggerthellaceae bacterium]